MADVHQLIVGGFPFGWTASLPVFTTFSFVNSTDQVEAIFQVPDDKGAASVTISRLGYALSAVTGTSPVMEIRLETVGTDGNPTGSLVQAGANATFTPTGSATFNWVNLTTPYAASRGQWLAWVIKYSSGTINASNRPIINVAINNTACRHPYAIGNVATVRTRLSAQPVFGFGSTTRAFGWPMQSLTGTGISTPNERGLRFMMDINTCTTFRVIGVWMDMTTAAAAKSTKVILYSGTTAIATATWDSDFAAAAAANGPVLLYFQDATLPVLSAGVEYRVGVQPQDASNGIVLHQADFAAAADLEALAGGQSWYLSTRAGAAWTDVTTSRPWMALILSDVTPPPPQVVVPVG